MGANSGDRIFSLLSEPPSDAASAQGLGRFSTRRPPWRVQATLAMNRQETAIGNGSRWLDGLAGPGRASLGLSPVLVTEIFPLPNVRVGSKAPFRPTDQRGGFTPDSRPAGGEMALPGRANTGLMRRSETSTLNNPQLVGHLAPGHKASKPPADLTIKAPSLPAHVTQSGPAVGRGPPLW